MSIRHARLVEAAGLALGLAGAAVAQPITITKLVLQGENAGGVGLATLIDNLAVNNSGQWLVECDTDNPNTTIDQVILKSGLLFLQAGQPLTAPAGATISSFDAVNLSNTGHSGWNFFLSGAVTGSTDSGMFYDSTLIFQESTISTATGFSPNTPYIGFFESKVNDLNQLLVVASVDDPAIASTVDRGLVVISYNAALGTFTETVLAKEGDILPGLGGALTDFGTGPHQFAFNNAGDAMFIADAPTDAIYKNMTQLAMVGAASPIAGRNWSSLLTGGVDMNSAGSTVFVGTLAGDTATDNIIIKNGTKFIQEGDPAPGSLAAFTVQGFGTARIVQISDAGDVLWFGDWSDANTAIDTGLFLNDRLLVQEGVTMIEGMTVFSIAGGQDAFAMSDNGRFIIFEATLTDGVTQRNGAFLIEVPQAACYANCDSSTAPPILNVNDFICFQNLFAASSTVANCDGSTTPPILNVNDFTCFLNAFAAGCT
ncbi:MAG: GC-type dockerin domain-anchored protein [Phycisphaerales bacterium]